MLDIAIVGSGLCGIALARALHAQGRSFALFEARARFGGRILSVPCARSGMAVDLGPTWFWPDTQPYMKRLVTDMGLSPFPQHDEGRALLLHDADKRPEHAGEDPVHGGAHRIEGGMERLTEALASALSLDQVHFRHVLVAMRDAGDHVVLEFQTSDGRRERTARQVVLAIPPRLLVERVRFEPALDEALQDAMRNTVTWMANRAKVVIGYDRPLWREVGQAGNAFVTHEQAVLGEVFDACDSTAAKAALGGFLAMAPETREAFTDGLPILMGNQIAQLFGSDLEDGEQHYQDWAAEPFTCGALDRETEPREHSGFANPLLRRTLWNAKLFLGGSETAAQGAGFLEGALQAARRIERALGRDIAPAQPDLPQSNAASIARFHAWVAAQSDLAFNSYRHRVTRALALQQRAQLTQQAVLESVEEVYGNALAALDDLPLDTSAVAVERGRSGLMPAIQEPFRDFMRSLLDDVIAFNRTSCALSNFPDEHKPSSEYVKTILRDVAAAWREFSLTANQVLLAKGRTARSA
jgi:monoamine oxidase